MNSKHPEQSKTSCDIKQNLVCAAGGAETASETDFGDSLLQRQPFYDKSCGAGFFFIQIFFSFGVDCRFLPSVNNN